MRRSFYGVVFFSVLALLSACKSTHSRSFEPGGSAPTFTITDQHGTQHSLESLRGKIVLVVLWATWCDSCKSQIAALDTLSTRYPADSFAVIAPVVNDSKDSYRAFIQKNPLRFITGVSQEDIASLYKITGVPEAFVIDKEGKFVLLQDAPGAAVRIVGPREWMSPLYLQQFERMISK